MAIPLSSLLVARPGGHLGDREMRALRIELQDNGRLRGNPAFLSIQTGVGSTDDITDRFLERDGVDLEREPDRSVRAACRVLEDTLKPGEMADTAEGLAALWRLTTTLVETIDLAQNPEPHPETLHSSWGTVSNTIERIAKSDAYDPSAQEQPNLDVILNLIERLQASPYPEPRNGQSDGMMAWGNWDVRVYAASSLMALAGRFADQRPQILDLLTGCLTDPTPTVRLQVAQSLNALWDIDRDRMWVLVTYVAEHEDDHGVLGFFISGPLQRIAGADADRCERLLSKVLNRLREKEASAEKRGTRQCRRGRRESCRLALRQVRQSKRLGVGCEVGSMIWCAVIRTCGRCCSPCAASSSSDIRGTPMPREWRCAVERRAFSPP